MSRLDPEEVARAVTAFINTTIMARSHPVQPDDNLELAGLDSMALLKVLLFIEAQFGFWMPDEDLVEENIKTPRAMAAAGMVSTICGLYHTSSSGPPEALNAGFAETVARKLETMPGCGAPVRRGRTYVLPYTPFAFACLADELTASVGHP